ncbi:MAG TPA: ABC transporter ATP-binding protein [Trebonia sp.]
MTATTDGLTVTGLEASYGRAKILRGVDLHVGDGELVGLAGRNGAGKTTTLRAISGVMPRRGRIDLDGTSLPGAPDTTARRGVIHVPERRGLFASLTVADNLRMGALAAGRRPDTDHFDRVMASFPALSALLSRPAGLCSGGEQQMVAIARGLMANPRILLIDELSLGLSPRATSDITQALIATCRERKLALLLVDQNIRMLTAVTDRLYLLDDGRTTEVGKGSDVAAEAVYFESL